jgi:hypothetical protein
VGESTSLVEIVEGQLGVVVAGVELLDAEVDRVGPVGEGGTDGVKATCGGEQLGDRTAHQ